MKILVTGATGFIGQHVVSGLLERNHRVIATGRSAEKISNFAWADDVQFVSHVIGDPGADIPREFLQCDAVIHLAWDGVYNCNLLSHFEDSLPANYRFLKCLIVEGVKHVLVSGTCYEYGLQTGCLKEDMPVFPNNPYALAKDALRRFLEVLQNENEFILQWARLFYMYGAGQNPNSLLAKLDQAIDAGETVFNMSGGEQLLDYLPVEEVSRRLVTLVENPRIQGIINCCSGKPVSVRRIVEKRIAARQANIRLNLGYYPYRDHESMAFWGNSEKLDRLLSS